MNLSLLFRTSFSSNPISPCFVDFLPIFLQAHLMSKDKVWAGTLCSAPNTSSIARITSSYTGSTSAFSTTEQCTCLPQTHCHGDSSSPCSQFLKNHNLVVPSCQTYSNNWSQDQNNLDLQSSYYQESLMKVPIQNNQSLKSDLFELLQKAAELDSSLKWRLNYISFEGNQCNKVSSFIFCIPLSFVIS